MNNDYSRRYPLAKSRVHHSGVLATFLAAVGLVMLFAGQEVEGGPWSGALLLALALVVLANTYRIVRDKRPRLVIDQRGVWYHDWGVPPLPYDQITDVYQEGSKVRGFLALRLADSEAFFAGLPEHDREGARRGRLFKENRFLIPNNAVEAPLGEIERAVMEARRHFTG